MKEWKSLATLLEPDEPRTSISDGTSAISSAKSPSELISKSSKLCYEKNQEIQGPDTAFNIIIYVVI